MLYTKSLQEAIADKSKGNNNQSKVAACTFLTSSSHSYGCRVLSKASLFVRNYSMHSSHMHEIHTREQGFKSIFCLRCGTSNLQLDVLHRSLHIIA
jgi:hypothetical protein